MSGEGPVAHIPVLLDEVLAALSPLAGSHVIDGTFGAGGYTRAILSAGAASVTAIDRDPDAIAAGQPLVEASAGRLRLVRSPFSRLDEAAESVDAVVLDIGVSSMQLDQAERGFSFRSDGPLDMRMARSGPTAADVVNRYKTSDLARIFGMLGEERHAGRVARMIERRRAERPFLGTLDLARAIGETLGHPPREKIHPATRAFQGLRIYVNDELGELVRALHAAERVLRPGGRLAVVTFHSLEDRIVKRFLADRAGGSAGSRHLPEQARATATFTGIARPVAPSQAETERNPRARSAKLRSATRTEAPARPFDDTPFGLPALPALPAAER